MALIGFADVDVRLCRPTLRTTILRGGSANYFDGTNSRVLDGSRWLQPLVHTTPMSGFAGLIQPLLRMVTPKYILLAVYAGKKYEYGKDKPISERLFKRWELATAIEQFLLGALPTDFVELWRPTEDLLEGAGGRPSLTASTKSRPTHAPPKPTVPDPPSSKAQMSLDATLNEAEKMLRQAPPISEKQSPTDVGSRNPPGPRHPMPKKPVSTSPSPRPTRCVNLSCSQPQTTEHFPSSPNHAIGGSRPAARNWFYIDRQGNQHGPVSECELESLYQCDEICGDSMVCDALSSRAGSPKWVPLLRRQR